MNAAQAQRFAQQWLDDWNRHDLAAILAHYTDDAELSSPAIAHVTGHAEGRLIGKEAIGKYWAVALVRFPDLRFELIAVLLGVDSVVIHYSGVNGRHVAEVCHFNTAGLVDQAVVHYA